MGSESLVQEPELGAIINRTFNLYFSQFWLFFVPFLVAGLITGGWGKIVSLLFPMPVAPSSTASLEVIFAYLGVLIVNILVTLFLTILVGWIINTIVSGMAVRIVANIRENQKTNLSDILGYTTTRLISLLGAGIITGILISLGLVALIIPGLILMTMFALTVPAIIIENTGALESLSRSRQLVGGRWLKTFGLILIIGIISFNANTIFGAISSVFGPADWVINGLLSAIVAPLLPISLAVYYYAMLLREQPSSPPPPTASTSPPPPQLSTLPRKE